MEPGNTIFYMIFGCAAFIVVLFFSKPLAILFKIFIRGIIGALGMYAVNFILLPLSISVGVNLLTALSVGVLGIPGFITLYALKLIL